MLTGSKVAAGIVVAVLLAGCEEMVEDEGAPVSARCDAAQDWFIGKPVAIYISGDVAWPRDDDERDVVEDAVRAIGDEYEGQPFTLERFKQLQAALFATGIYQEGNRKWGIETVARPGLPDDLRLADPNITTQGCAGVELMMFGRIYLPQKPWERPLRLTE